MGGLSVKALLTKGLALMGAVLTLSGCLEEAGKSSSIVIPPGSIVFLDMKKTNEVSEKSFALYLAEATNTPKLVNNVMDLTSAEKPDLIRQILPKGLKTEKGVLVARVVMEYRNTPWFAIVFPDEVVTPNIDTTLVFQLLSNYPNKNIRDFSVEDIKDITQKVAAFREARTALFNIPPDFNPDLVYRFLRNGLSGDYAFLEFLKGKGIEFNYNDDGDILSEPYPFGIKNRPPEVDFKSTTRLATQIVKEMSELKIRATVKDPDGDEVFFAWFLEDQPFKSTENAFVWTPDYDAARSDEYVAKVMVSDGGKVTLVSWKVDVQNVNRRPIFSHNCPESIIEDQEVSCEVSYSDQDGETVQANVLNIEDSSPVIVDDVNPAPFLVTGKSSVNIKWTPNNGDALKKQGIVTLELMDTSGGVTIAPIVFKVVGSNRPPTISEGPVPLDPARELVEWDTCAKMSSDGQSSPYKFTITFEDPDNMGPKPASPLDKISVTYGGTLRADIVEESKVVGADNRTTITYRWMPNSTRLSGSWTLSVRDDQGGIAPLITKNMVAENRNSVPCLNAGDHVTQVTLLNPFGSYSFNATDTDGVSAATDMPVGEIYDVDSNGFFLKHSIDARTNKHLVMRRKFFETGVSYRRRDTSHVLRFFPKTSMATNNVFIAGYVKIVRPAPYNSALTIPKGTELATTIPVSGVNAAFKILYETADAVQFDPGDAEIWIPVKAKDRTSPANVLNTFAAVPTGGAAIPVDFTVKNTAAVGETGMVTISRGNTAANFVFTRYQVIRGETATSSYEHLLPDDFVFPAGQSEISFPVWKRVREVPVNQSLTFTTGAPGGVAMTVTAISGLMDWNDTEVKRTPTYHYYDSLFKVRVLDGNNVAANSIKTVMDSAAGNPAGEGGTLTFTHAAGMFVTGQVTIKRSKTTSAWTLPVNTRIRTNNYTIFELVENAQFAAGASTVTVWVQRKHHVGLLNRVTNPVREYAVPRFRFTDSNMSMSLATDDTIYANEGSDLTGALVEFSEVSDLPNPLYQVHPYWYPKDRYDFYSRYPSFNGSTPKNGAGAIKFCREPGAFDAGCTSCNADGNTGVRSYFRSARCYLRYKYHDEDLSKGFSIKIQLRESATSVGRDDFNTTIPDLNLNYYTQHSINLVVKEVNDPPVIVGPDFLPIPAPTGRSEVNPINLGVFTEGVESAIPIHILDTDRGAPLKKVFLQLANKVYDLKKNAWVPLPDGVLINTLSEVDNDPTGRGLRTTAEIRWKPSDADTKRLAGSDGFVFKVIAKDNINTPANSLSTEIYYKVVLQNLNNSPSISEIAPNSKIRVYADSYVKFQIEVQDPDFAIPEGVLFQTRFSFCRDINNNILLHPTLDAPSADPTVCHATSGNWPVLLTQYSASYVDNSAVSICRSGSGLNEDLAVPKISPAGPPQFINQKYRQIFDVEWCPQKGHMGTHSVSFVGADNGDMNRNSEAQPFKETSQPLTIDVVSPVYLVSPRNDFNENPVHFMKQTAAGLADAPFKYEIIAKNTLDNPLKFELLQSPRPCGEENGVCIDETKGVITWVPKHPDDITTSGPGHLFRVRVLDLKTGDSDTAHFYLKVQSAISPFEVAPVINSAVPTAESTVVSEEQTILFSVVASDSNPNDQLHYKWFVNDKLVEDEGSSFVFKPSDREGSVDRDGNGPAKLGEYVVRAEVTDGNTSVSRTWNIKIRNTKLLGEMIFDLASARLERSPSKLPKNIFWGGEVANTLNQSGVKYDQLVFTGSYELDIGLKHFIWDLPIVNGAPVRQNLNREPWNLIEDLPWPAGRKSERLVINTSGVIPEAIVTSQSARGASFATTVEAVRLPMSDWTVSEIGSSNKCLGECPTRLYTSDLKSDSRITLTYDGSYVFYASDDRKKLNHDFLSPSNLIVDYNFGSELISGIAQNRVLNRIYVTTQGLTESKLYIFNASGISGGGALTLVSSVVIWDGVTGHENARASDIAVDDTTGRVFLLLTATGGVATFVDSGGAITAGNLAFIGVNELGSSAMDVAGKGVKLALNKQEKILYGVMRESQQAFSIDTQSLAVQIASTPSLIDSIYTYESGMILLVDREKARIYFSK